jgi:hypothetical protein
LQQHLELAVEHTEAVDFHRHGAHTGRRQRRRRSRRRTRGTRR